ncbi:MAG: ABC transporter ATP-binding protein [Sedimentisphaerales bacterium]|nr:ABC transporter ATP-binding protein [Sedimentisphaerales bacterium]
MRALWQMFQYIWPQWPRVIAVFVSAMVIGLLLSVSFMAIIPMLTVMMGGEGLHGWVDRNLSERQYGLRFNTPKVNDLADAAGASLRHHLLVTHVEKGGIAYHVGIKANDHIADVNDIASEEGQSQVPYTRLLTGLARATKATIPVMLLRPSENSAPTTQRLDLPTPANEAYIKTLDWTLLRTLQWRAYLAVLGVAQRAVSVLPREQTPANQIRTIAIIMLAMVVITVVRCTAKYYQDYLGEKIVQVAVNHMREDVFAHVTHMPMSAFARERPSDAISRIVRDTTTMGAAVKVLLGKGLREPMIALFLAGTALVLNWQLTLVFLGSAPFVIAVLGTFGSKMKKATRRSLVVGSEMLGRLQEAMVGLKIVKVYNRQQHEQERFKGINDRLLKQLLRISKVEAATHPALEVLGILAGSAAIIVGMNWVLGGGLDGVTFLVLLASLGASAESVRKTSDIWNRIQQANAAAERVFAMLDQPLEFEKPDAIVLPPARGTVEFRNVVFTYPGAERPTLTGVSLHVTAGQNVAIVGPNGSGKTTLVNLLPRFYDPDSGRVFLDGHDIKDVSLMSLRDQIGMVTQDVITFNDTIATNIAYGRRDATQEETVDAAKRAFAHEFISQMPDGYNTMIGENSTGLSGGQLQRIIIARAILKNPSILIFDEATSQVDADSEAKIHQAIEEVMRGRTTFIIAHRFSTVVSADTIVVMNSGRIIAQGHHERLMQTCPVYQRLYETQLIQA